MLRKNYLAPIDNYTNLAFRLLVQKHGAKAAMVPLVSASALSKSSQYLNHLELSENEKHLGVQLVGIVPDDFKKAAIVIAKNFPFVKWIDINAGCPSPRTFGSGCGSALLEKPALLRKIVGAAKEAGLPVSVKMRLAKTMEKTLTAVAATQNADFLIVHGRTPNQFYSGKADWEAIKKINENSGIPVIGNGDIRTIAQGEALVKNNFCDSFMIGRAALSNPLVFEGKEAATLKEKKRIFCEYLKIVDKYSERRLADLRLKCFEFFKNLPGSASLRGSLSEAKTTDELLEKIEKF
ncbi:MAG: tRNA-dihydrouridine synthase [Candidatus ainarchaeum sp.]|nr:tRNA-dihydrouridine synthase [Candidatus ainarchaeum sp.]